MYKEKHPSSTIGLPNDLVYIRKREIKKNLKQCKLTSERTRKRRRKKPKLVEGNNKVQSENKRYREQQQKKQTRKTIEKSNSWN